MSQNKLKALCARAALDYILPKLHGRTILGIGTGSTTNLFIELMAQKKIRLKGAVASSIATKTLLEKHEIKVFKLDEVDSLELYIDGADESNSNLELVKGGGGALTQEKIVAAASKEFVCIVDHTKWVSNLGEFPLPVEVIPTSIKYVSKEIKEMGGDPEHRKGVITDNGNLIIDVKGLYPISKPKLLEKELNNIAGVVTNGIFALRPADKIFVASKSEVSEYSRPLASS